MRARGAALSDVVLAMSLVVGEGAWGGVRAEIRRVARADGLAAARALVKILFARYPGHLHLKKLTTSREMRTADGHR